MQTLCGRSSWSGYVALLPPSVLELLLAFSNASLPASLLTDWNFWARWSQLPPPGEWRSWVFLGGRGAGKTRAGAEWVTDLVWRRQARRIALVAPTFHDVREVMIEGPSGLRAPLRRQVPTYEPSRRRLIWPNGAQAYCFSAEDPAALRGPQFDAAWCDEMCFWSRPDETMATLEHGMRLGQRPRVLVTTTPRPLPALKRLLAASGTVVTRASTWENQANLAPGFIDTLNQTWVGDARQRQELLGELIEDFAGALWRRIDLERLRAPPDAPLERIVVAVDPPTSVGPSADRCGIVAAATMGEGAARRAVVLADASVQGAAPHEWAGRVAALAHSVGAGAIIAEGNNGGELVRGVLQAAAPELSVRIVHARAGKRARAEPIAALYAQGRVTHAAAFADLEDEMCAFGADDFSGSPDRVDALVWALTDLMLGGAGPRVRAL